MSADNQPITYYAQTMPGVEEIAWLEIRDQLPQVKFGEYQFAKDQNGIVVFQYAGPTADLFKLRTTEDIFLLALSVPKLSRGRRDLAQVQEWVQKGEAWGQAVNYLLRYRQYDRPPTYRVISRKYGKHEYRRKDLQQAVLHGLERRYPRWQPVADGGQVEVWVNLLGSHLLCGLRLSDKRMRHRYEKAVELPASLRPSVAAAMVYLTQPEKNDVFVDPMCGSGTLLMERLMAGPYRRLSGGDINPEHVKAAQQNVRTLPHTPKNLVIQEWDACHLPLNTYEANKVATNLPFGKQVSSKTDIQRLYPDFFAELARIIKPGGRAVILSSEYDLLKEAVRQQPKLDIQRGYSIAVLGQWGRIYIIERTL